ncbi:hypothetical protein BMS3Abin04_02526 [bacterium BMS3Abin04]|nr:hypothetical protein BMS3Abin04_02526 [bacterium BMS3Abin04]
MEKQEIKKIITEYLIKKDEILIAYIFGSFVHKNKFHDIDIAVYLKNDFNKNDLKKYPYGYESELISDLTKLVRSKIDFIVINNAGITIQHRIVNKGMLLFSKDEKFRISFENYIRKLYIDAENIRKIKRKYLVRKINNA